MACILRYECHEFPKARQGWAITWYVTDDTRSYANGGGWKAFLGEPCAAFA